MRDLLFTFNTGDIDAFDKIATSAPFKKTVLHLIPFFTNKAILESSLGFIKQKLCIMTLVESVFKRSKDERSSIGFTQLSKECRVPFAEVEHLVMKALSLGLIRGQIDEVDQTVKVS